MSWKVREPENKKGDCSPFLLIAFVASSDPGSSAGEGKDDGQDETHYKQDPGNVGGCAGDPGKSEDPRHDGDNQEGKRPIEHKELLLVGFGKLHVQLDEADFVPSVQRGENGALSLR